MNRLIYADKIIQKLDEGTRKFEKERENKKGEEDVTYGCLVGFICSIEAIKAEPTAFDLDKVIEQFEKEKNPIYREDGSLMSEKTMISIDKAIEIIKSNIL